MVDLKDTGEIAWLKGMVIGGKFISQALQQTMFKMNEYGAQAKSAVAIKLSRTAFVKVNNKKTYIIDEPFYCWVSRPGVRHPLFVGYIQPEYWKNPGTVPDLTPQETFKEVEPLRICNQ